MHTPKNYRNENIDEIHDFIKHNSFGILINQVDGKPWATHIPLVLDKNEEGSSVLVGHISRANPQWKEFQNNEQVMVIFSGPHTYISPSWYDHENVPTWNYLAVHVYGTIKIMEGESLYNALAKLVDKYEVHSERPVSVHTMSQEMVRKEMKGVVGFEISMDEVQATYKLSQNRDKHNHTLIIEELEKKGEANATEIANEMRKRVPEK
ncbi:FMN-binding negative transcriptional regulator [Solitalea canadensis]|uniref:Transcriptional regulator n=1 Tax=Solitalea canadensis (strain ATCC 29591 / DSM 3403 / JCM 21819 / LMG 8368 / NBRC 15130 / NCIMB 12057 / USAM 9D) TaxID=929556 RepID=H8KP99_SOLCM|nr:FMN-binding negative transcriptional regulator [Solitalea canadensis]AFD05736.1 transcriptional regulator [Solitalea canadensis DSM 3403]